MANQQVPKQATPISEAEMARAFIDVARELFGINLTKEQVALLIAQNNVETASRKYMWNYNIGNITHTDKDNNDYFIGGDKTRGSDGKWKPIQMKFRAYPNLYAGVKDYLTNLKNRAKGSVWQTILQGDPAAFAKSLKDSRYYEADEKDYRAGLVNHVKSYYKNKSYENAIAGNFNPVSPKPTSNPIPNNRSNKLDVINNLLDKFLSALASAEINRK